MSESALAVGDVRLPRRTQVYSLSFLLYFAECQAIGASPPRQAARPTGSGNCEGFSHFRARTLDLYPSSTETFSSQYYSQAEEAAEEKLVPGTRDIVVPMIGTLTWKLDNL